MRLVRLLFGMVLLGMFGALLLLVLAQNWRTTEVDFFGLQYSIHLAWVLVGAAVFGALITLILLLPGRFAAMLHTWSLERELRQWEQDLWKVQEQRERLLARHEHLLEAHQHLLARHERLLQVHERVVQIHHRLVGEHSQAIAERDQARAQVAAAHTSPAQLSARQSSTPLVAVVSPGASGASDPATRTSAASRLHAHGRHGGRGNTSAPRSPRWAARWPTTRAAVTAVRPAPPLLQGPAGDDDRGARKARETTPLGDQPPVMQPPLAPIGVGPVADTGDGPTREFPPTPPAKPLTSATGDPALPLTRPVLTTEPAVSVSGVSVAPPTASPLLSPFLLRSLQRAAERASASLTPPLATLQRWRHTEGARMVATLTAKRDMFEARLAHLKRSLFPGALPPDALRSIPSDLPSGDDQR